MSDADDAAERFERQMEDLRDQLASTQHDVDAVRSRQERDHQRGAARQGGRGRRRTVFPEHDPDTGEPVENGFEWAVRPFLLRYRRRWRYTQLRFRRWLVWFVIWLVGTGVAATVWGPGSPFSPDLKCGPETSALGVQAVAGESIAVRTAKLNGRLLHALTGPPLDPKVTQAKARDLGHAIALSVVALQASIRGEEDPASVRADTAAYRARKAAQAQQVASSCAPVCPPGQEPRESLTVAFRPAGANPRWEAQARAAASAAGAAGQNLEVAMRLAWAESQFKATAKNPHSSASGVWQVMVSAHQEDPEIGRVMDPYANARMMRRISRNFTDWSPWSTWPKVRADMAAASTTAVQPAAAVDPAGSACATAPAPSTYKTGAGVAWGGYSNGRIPITALAHPRSAPNALLRPDAAAALDRLSTAYQARFGKPLGVTDSYRDYAGQVSVYARKPGLAAEPGTSNHGWALAFDGVIGGYTSTDYLWLRANAPAFGWDNPGWARPGGSSKHEPWHWEFNPIGATT